MAEKKIQSQFLVVKAPFYYQNDQLFAAGQVVDASHPVVKKREHLFRALEPLGGKAPAAEPAPEPEKAPADEPSFAEKMAAAKAAKAAAADEAKE